MQNLLVRVLGLVGLDYTTILSTTPRGSRKNRKRGRTIAGGDGVHADVLVGPLSSERPPEVANGSVGRVVKDLSFGLIPPVIRNPKQRRTGERAMLT